MSPYNTLKKVEVVFPGLFKVERQIQMWLNCVVLKELWILTTLTSTMTTTAIKTATSIYYFGIIIYWTPFWSKQISSDLIRINWNWFLRIFRQMN